MQPWTRIRDWLRAVTRRAQLERDLEAELRFHMETCAADLVRAGVAPAQAMRRARIEFGGTERVKEECRQAAGIYWMGALAQDTRHGLRTVGKSPAFSLVAILILALGTGATIAIFSIVNGVVLKPLPYPNAERLLTIDVTPLALDPAARGIAPEDYFVFREQNRTLEDIGIYAETDTDRGVNVTGAEAPERVHALHVTDGVLPVLGIRPMLGRIFSRADDAPGAPLAAIVTYGYWKRRYAGSPSAVGQTIVVDGTARQIIGVLPAHFRFFELQDLALILPLQLDRDKVYLGNFSYFGIGRLKRGQTLEEANSDIARLLPIVLNSFPAPQGIGLDSFKNARIVPSLRPLKQDVIGNVARLLWVLMAGVTLVLLIACANVANLLLVRTEGRQHELAVRTALGAGRRRIAILLACEGAVLAFLGSTLGLGIAWIGLHLIMALAPAGLPRIGEIGIDGAVLLFTAGLAVTTASVSAVIPVFKYAGVRAAISQSSRIVGASRRRHRVRNLLVMAQVALALVLLVCSGLMMRTFRALTRVDAGFALPAGIQTFRIAIPRSDVADDSRVVRVEQQIQDKLAAIPGVSAVAFSSAVPLDGDNMLDNVYAADHSYGPGELPPLRHLVCMSPGYLHTLGTPIVAGRDINWTDVYDKLPVALISENFAREYWRTPAAALGKRIRIFSNDDWREIIGVAGDVHDAGLDRPARTDVYWPALAANFQGEPLRVIRNVAFLVRGAGAGKEALMKQMRAAVWSVDPKLPLASAYTLGYLYSKSLVRTSFSLAVLGIAAAIALLLGAIGLYGVIAYSVLQRTREIGIRIALGSERKDVVKMVLHEGMMLIGIGIAVGLTASCASTRFLASLLFGVNPTDPLTFSAVITLLGAIALIACYLPARRAARIDPIVALRYE